MAQPHEYQGNGTPVESYYANPFPGETPPWVPGQLNEVDVSVSSRSITDAATVRTVTSTTANPMPHVEYGRIGAN